MFPPVGSLKQLYGTKVGTGVLKIAGLGPDMVQLYWISGTVTFTDDFSGSVTLSASNPSLVLEDLKPGSYNFTQTGTGTWGYTATVRAESTVTRP